MPSESFIVRSRPSDTQPYVRMMIVFTLADLLAGYKMADHKNEQYTNLLATLNVNALMRPMIKNWLKFKAAAARPEHNSAIKVSCGMLLTSGMVSKNGTRKARRKTEIGAWLRSSWGEETLKS